VARKLCASPGLAEADRLGLEICAEIVEGALAALAGHPRSSERQRSYVLDAAELLVKADVLENDPDPVQIARWWRALEPAAREFARAVHDLPHR
jgi:hypothetical protein